VTSPRLRPSSRSIAAGSAATSTSRRASRARFVGSPTVRGNGRDVDPDGELDAEYTTECRLYWHEHRLAGYPRERLIREALLRAAGRT
jgi:hypothetical protein